MADLNEMLARQEALAAAPTLGNLHPDSRRQAIARSGPWEDGQAVEVWQTAADFSDLDAAMTAAEGGSAPLRIAGAAGPLGDPDVLAAGLARDAIEAQAREIYDGWKAMPGWVPWVDGGNSHRQDDARRIAGADGMRDTE